MPSVSRAQQRAAILALLAKRGKINPARLKGAALQMYRSMTIEQLEEYAHTRRKNLPKHVSRRKRR